MNLPYHMTITKNGVVLHSNFMSDTCGIHTFIEGDEVKVERINPTLTDCTMKKEKKNYGSAICIAIFLIGFFVVVTLYETNSIFGFLFGVPHFFLLGREKIPALFRKFCYIRKRRKNKSCKTQELLIALFSAMASQFFPETSYSEVLERVEAIHKKEYEEKFYFLTSISIFCIITSPLFFFLQTSTLFPFIRWLLFIIGCIITSIVSFWVANLLERKDFAKHFERFFIAKPSELESKAVITGLEEWQRMEDEIFKNRLEEYSQM